ncbi:hypothetical protein THAOC_25792, partial [Thalassiosira oceanica]
MDNLPPGARERLGPAVRVVMQSTAAAGNPKRGRRKKAQFRRFRAFCASFNINPTLESLPDKFPFMSAYAWMYRCGELAANGSAVKSRSAEDQNPQDGRPLDPPLEGLDWKSYDDPPKRVKPIPLGILLEAQRIAEQNGSPAMMATVRMMWIAYFFLCRPGEYCSTVDEGNKFFRLSDVGLRNGDRALDLATASPEELRRATFAMLEFTDQKNCNRGEKVGQYDSGHQTASATKAIAEQVLHLRDHGAPADAPLVLLPAQWPVVLGDPAGPHYAAARGRPKRGLQVWHRADGHLGSLHARLWGYGPPLRGRGPSEDPPPGPVEDRHHAP